MLGIRLMKTRYAVVIGCFVVSSLGGLGFAIHHHGYLSGQSDNNQTWEIKWGKRDGKDLLELAGRQLAEREEENRRQKEKEEIVKNAEIEKQKALADVAAADAVADQLRGTLASIRHQFAASETSKLSTNAAVRYSAAETIGVLADMLTESDKRSGALARYADEAASAGAVCNSTYNAVTRVVE